MRDMARTYAGKKTKAAVITGAGMFNAIVAMARRAGDFSRAEHILESCRPCEYGHSAGGPTPITVFQFDFVPQISFGCNEGMFLDCYLRGRFDDSSRYSICIGSMRILSRNKDTCKILGELSGALTYHAHLYIAIQEHCVQGLRSLESGDGSPQISLTNCSVSQTTERPIISPPKMSICIKAEPNL